MSVSDIVCTIGDNSWYHVRTNLNTFTALYASFQLRLQHNNLLPFTEFLPNNAQSLQYDLNDRFISSLGAVWHFFCLHMSVSIYKLSLWNGMEMKELSAFQIRFLFSLFSSTCETHVQGSGICTRCCSSCYTDGIVYAGEQ